MKNSKDLGERKHHRISFKKPGFVIPTPDAAWIDCVILDVSAGGVCLDVGELPIPKVFGLAFDPAGSVVRVCTIAWRRGELVGAQFLSAKTLRQDRDPRHKAKPPAGPAASSSGYRSGLLSRV